MIEAGWFRGEPEISPLQEIIKNLEEDGVPFHSYTLQKVGLEALRLFMEYQMVEHREDFTKHLKNKMVKKELKNV